MDENERKYLEEKIGGLERLAEQRFEHVESTAKAFFNEMGRRLEEHNQFREQILRERGDFVSKEAFDYRQREINIALKSIEDFVSNLKGANLGDRSWRGYRHGAFIDGSESGY